MKKEIKFVNEEKGIVRITTMDERWYTKRGADDATGLPTFNYYPSVTWILSVFPKLGLMKLRDELGAEETDLLKKLGGERGSKVHDAITAIIEGLEVRIDSKFTNPTTGQPEELTAEEIAHIQSFIEWQKAAKPKWIVWDATVISEKYGFGGTIDAVAEIEGEIVFIDFKTSKVIGKDYEMQISAYAAAVKSGENEFVGIDPTRPFKLAILQLGQKPLKTNPATYRWREVEDCMDLFVATRRIWADVYENQIRDGKGYSQKDYPIVLSPALSLEEALDANPTIAEIEQPLPRGVKKPK